MNSNREYKSDVFTMLVDIPEHALEIYNVLNGSGYGNPKALQIMRLEKGVLLSIRNDASFIVDSYLNLYEHQSTYNPNMPLRFLIYFSNLLLDMVKEHDYDLFGRKQIPVPTPKFVVFYNGLDKRPAREVMHLSDAYEHKDEQYDLDLTCIVYNINPGYNKDIQEKSRVISGYTSFVEKVRTYEREEAELKDAVERAIDECIREDILAEFFKEHRTEVVNMAALDFTFERREELIRRDSLEEGFAQGMAQGISQGISQGMSLGILQMYKKGLSVEQIADIMDKTVQEVNRIVHEKGS